MNNQVYIFMSPSVYESHGSERFPDAVDVNDYRLAPFVKAELEGITKYCQGNNIPTKSTSAANIIKTITNGTASVIFADIEKVFEVKKHFEPEFNEE